MTCPECQHPVDISNERWAQRGCYLVHRACATSAELALADAEWTTVEREIDRENA